MGEVHGHARSRGLKGLVSKCLAPIDGRLHQELVRESVALDACTQILLDSHRSAFGALQESTKLIANATNVTRFAPRPAEEVKSALGLSRLRRIIGYVGGSPAERGGMQVLEVVARLRREVAGLGAVIVGDDKGQALRRRSQELGIADRVILPGVVPYDGVPDYVRCFDMGIALDDPARAQRTGNSYQKVRQYLACGKPVITCLADDSPMARQPFVYNVHPSDTHRIEQAVLGILRTPDRERTDLSSAGGCVRKGGTVDRADA